MRRPTVRGSKSSSRSPTRCRRSRLCSCVVRPCYCKHVSWAKVLNSTLGARQVCSSQVNARRHHQKDAFACVKFHARPLEHKASRTAGLCWRNTCKSTPWHGLHRFVASWYKIRCSSSRMLLARLEPGQQWPIATSSQEPTLGSRLPLAALQGDGACLEDNSNGAACRLPG